uniref:Uncharacterized protein n=1 Tax=Rhipicephalus appendiculatus TaxID=34631 RepID=A0A131YEF3_RHIAP
MKEKKYNLRIPKRKPTRCMLENKYLIQTSFKNTICTNIHDTSLRCSFNIRFASLHHHTHTRGLLVFFFSNTLTHVQKKK